MKRRLLELLSCPECGGRLKLKPGPELRDRPWADFNPRRPACSGYCGWLDSALPLPADSPRPDCALCYGQEVMTGALLCGQGHEYEIAEGVPVLLAGPLSGTKARTAEAFGYEWLRYRVELQEEERGIFLAETQSRPEDFADRLVLDAGCGMGRFTKIAARLGAEVIGLDLSPAAQAVFKAAAEFPRLHVIRGDLLRPPLRASAFDLVYSLGVLHHTPDTRRAFRAISALVKPGGAVAFWVYGRAGAYEHFKSNPLEPMRAAFFRGHPRLHFPYWVLLKIRERVSDALRFFTTRLPAPLLYQLCLLATPPGAVPLLKYFTFSAHPNWRVRRQENFDWLSPPFQFKHTKEEARAWIAETGLIEEKMLPHGLVPKIGFKAGKK